MPTLAEFDALTKRKSVLVVGDLIYDISTEVYATKITPDAPAPVLTATGNRAVTLGGAGNVARQFTHLNAAVTLATVHAGEYAYLFREAGVEVIGATNAAPRKERLVAGGQTLARIDHAAYLLRNAPAETQAELQAEVAKAACDHITDRRPDIVVFSDYAYASMSGTTAAQISEAARFAGCAIVIDPKPAGVPLSSWRGGGTLKLNTSELGAVAKGYPSDEQAASSVAAALGCDVVVTRGARAPIVVSHGRPGDGVFEGKRPPDFAWPSGAGDCFAAYLAAGLYAELPLSTAAVIAHAAGRAFVERPGGAAVHPRRAAGIVGTPAARVFSDAPHLAGYLKAEAAAADLTARPLRVGFTNGRFDLFHAGHASVIEYAAARCDLLVVGVNSDHSYREITGKPPTYTQGERLRLAAAAGGPSCVAVPFGDATPHKLVAACANALNTRLAFVCKGHDYAGTTPAGAECAESVLIAPQEFNRHSADTRRQIQDDREDGQ